MNNFKKWQTLNESLGFPLGVKTTASLGVIGGYGELLDEVKKKMKHGKKKFNGDIGPGDMSVGDDDDDDDIVDLGDDDDDDDDEGHVCKCPKPDLGDEMGDEGGEPGIAPAVGKGGPPMKFMKKGKKCMKCKMKYMGHGGKKKMYMKKKKMQAEDIDSATSMTEEEIINELGPLMAAGLGAMAGKMMKKKMKGKKMQSETTDPFGSYYTPHNQQPDLGSKEYAEDFYRSLEDHFGNPNQKFDTGVDLEEEVIFKPQPEEDNPIWQTEPKAGEPGFAPVGKVGGNLGGEQTPPTADWEQQWSPVSDQ